MKKKPDDQKLAEMLDSEKQNTENVSRAPDGEFDAILEEMKRRGISPRIRKELKKKK